VKPRNREEGLEQEIVTAVAHLIQARPQAKARIAGLLSALTELVKP